MNFDEITIQYGGASARIAPARGALVTSLRVRHTELLYLDRETFNDESKNVRGGIPILFPCAGKLEGDKFADAGTAMKQHGFIREKRWAVSEKTESRLACVFDSNESTRAIYPFDFRIEQNCQILPAGLHVELLISNRGEKPLPVSPGWHPYFNCADSLKNEIRSNVAGFNPKGMRENPETGYGVAAPIDGRSSFKIPQVGAVSIRFSPEMRFMQFWSPPGKEFVCLEPFFGPLNTLNTPARMEIPPGEARAFWMRIELE